MPVASAAPLASISDGFTTALRRFAGDQKVPWVDFVKGARKDDSMDQHLAAFTGTEGVFAPRSDAIPTGTPTRGA